MAAKSAIRSVSGTLVASTADTITLSGAGGGAGVEVTHHGAAITAPLYVRLDGTAAAVAANENYVVAPGQTRIFSSGASTISVICSATAGYTVALI